MRLAEKIWTVFGFIVVAWLGAFLLLVIGVAINPVVDQRNKLWVDWNLSPILIGTAVAILITMIVAARIVRTKRSISFSQASDDVLGSAAIILSLGMSMVTLLVLFKIV